MVLIVAEMKIHNITLIFLLALASFAFSAPQGDQGPAAKLTGPQGDPTPTGKDNPQGDQGPASPVVVVVTLRLPTGPQGETGLFLGPTGPQGETGIVVYFRIIRTGPQGETGPVK